MSGMILDRENKEKVAIGVSSVLADTFSLYLKTLNYHWNVTGSRFHQLHELFETHYKELADSVDDIAERLRSLGFKSPGTYKEFMQMTQIEDGNAKASPDQMILDLAQNHQQIANKAREVVQVAGKFHDESTSDLLSGRISHHEKTAWMLRSFLE